MEGEDKENMADNSQSSQVSQEDVRAGYRSLIKDLVLAEDNILAAEAAAGEEGEGKITYDVFRGRREAEGDTDPKSCCKLNKGDNLNLGTREWRAAKIDLKYLRTSYVMLR